MKKFKSKPKKISLRSLPSKRSINLATVGEKPIKASQAIPAIVIILVIAGLIGKFAVYDRYSKLNKAQSQVASLQRQIDEGYEQIASFGSLAEEYAHYTFSYMTEAELNRADRVELLAMIQENVMNELKLQSLSLKDNRLELTVSGKSLQQINEIARALQDNSTMVDYTTVNTASTQDNKGTNVMSGGVTATISVQLNGPKEEAALK